MKQIALVEDNEDNRALIGAIVEGTYELSEYGDGPSALAGMIEHQPDLVLLDISLPGMTGIEVLRTIRAHDQLCKIPVIALTAHAMAGDRERFVAEGFDAYLSKPIIDDQILLDIIQHLLDDLQ